MNRFHCDKIVKQTRKPHECEQCGQQIEAGMSALKSTGMFDGYLYSHYQHIACHQAAWEWAKLCDAWGEEFPWFQHMENSEFEHHAWLRENHPIVADRLRIPVPELEGA